MARTRKSISTQNLATYDVLIEDQGPRSDYFKLSQFDGYFYGGRNAFLVAGSAVLKPRSRVLVEILNKEGNTVYSTPISTFSEGNSRLIQVEVYEDTPIGPGKIVILGSANTYIDGRPIPDEWVDKFNVRWVTDVIISPRIENRTQIRFQIQPSLTVNEKFYSAPSSSRFEREESIPVDVNLSTKFYNVYPNGYLAQIVGPTTSTRYFSKYVGGVLTGSLNLSGSGISETASIRLPLDKIYTAKLAESDANIIITDKGTQIRGGFISSSGDYTTNIDPLGNVTVSSSLNLVYNELIAESTGSSVSFADIRLVDLSTISGEINKVRFSYKPSTEPGEYRTLGEVPTIVNELLAVDSGSTIAETGKFRTIVIDDYWYSATMSVERGDVNPTVPDYYYTSSLVTTSPFSVTQCCADLLDSVNVTPQIVGGDFIDGKSYFLGTKESNAVTLFPRTEYTLAFESLVTKTSASIELNQADSSIEVYIAPTSGSRILDTNPLGQLLGTITPTKNFKRQNFGNTELNFTPKIASSGQYVVRFVIYGGFWNIANVSVKPATEPFFSPDEINTILPNLDFSNEILTFKAEYLDVNNNSIGINTLSLPTFFTGSDVIIPTIYSGSFSGSLLGTASYAENSNLLDGLDSSVFATTGSNVFIGNQTITGSIYQSGSIETLGLDISLQDNTEFVVSGSELTFDFDTFDMSGSMVVTGSNTTVGTHTVLGNQNISGSLILSGSNNAIIGYPGDLELRPFGLFDSVLLQNSVGNDIINAGFFGGVYGALINDLLVVSGSTLYAYNGKVGIGTISPSNTLDVIGNVSASSFTGSFAGTASYAESAPLPSGVVSSSLQIDHDSTSNFVANEHINHSSVSIIAGQGLTGGGTIASSRTLNVGGGTGIAVSANSIALTGQALALHSLSTNGIIARTSAGVVAGRTITAGTGIDVTNGNGVSGNPTIAVDVSDFMTSGSDNRVITATSADGLNAESNLTFDGSTLALTGDFNVGSGDLFVDDSAGRVGIGTTTPAESLHVVGDIVATSDITAYYSDERLKNKIDNISNAIDIIKNISGFRYTNNKLANSLGFNNNSVQIGLSAQEVERVVPEVIKLAPFDMKVDKNNNVVSKTGENYLTLDYSKLIPVLIEAIKEQQKLIEDLQNKIKDF